MKIEDIQTLVAELNAATAKKTTTPKKKPAATPTLEAVFPVKKTNGHTHLTPEDHLVLSAKRIHLAFDLASRGVTVEAMIARVKFVEAKGEGAVQ